MDKYLEIKGIFELCEDKENAIAMSKYMRNLFDFYGFLPRKEEMLIVILSSRKRN